jgi:hypothetical protein
MKLESDPKPIPGDTKAMESWLKGGSSFMKLGGARNTP